MKEHDDAVMLSVDKSTVSIDDSTGVDKPVTETLGDVDGQTEGVLTEKDEGEDAMVDVVGSDSVEEDDHVRTVVNLDNNLGSEKLECMQKETENHDQDMEDVAGSGEDCDASVEVRVLTSEKDEVIVHEEEVAGSGEDCNSLIETSVLNSEKVEVIVNEELDKSNDFKKLHVESVEEVLTTNLVSQAVEMVVDPFLVCDNNYNQSSAADVASSRTDEVDERVEVDSQHPTIEVITDDAQETTDADHMMIEETEKESETLDSSKISEPLVTVNPGFEDADVAVKEDITVDSGFVCVDVVNSVIVEGVINAHVENLDQQTKVDKLSEKESFNPTVEAITEADVMVNKETEAGLAKNEIIEQSTEPVQVVAYENGVMDDKTGKEDEILDSSKIPESIISREDADVDRGEVAGMDIDEVMGWKYEVPEINITTNSEADVEQKLPEPSSKPALIRHRDEHINSREPIVYGRRAHVEVPLYEPRDVDRKLPEPSSPISEDENLKIETDSERDDEDNDDDNESIQEDDQKVVKGKPELLETGNLFSLNQPSYFKPPTNEGEFSVSDMVWGKVRSHPWWPGQIIDPSNASKKAMKYYKKDRFLVAYFGDHTFAWNNPSVLTPFRANFSQHANQTDTEIFKIAVGCALEEVTRRVELGLACSCIPKEIYKKIEYQVTENGGVRKKSSKIHGKDESALVSSFEPDKLVDYVRLLAQFPAQGDKLDLAITTAQLTSYGHYKGHRELTEFSVWGDMLEEQEAFVDEPVEQVYKNGEKIENDLIEIVNPNKEISLSDITDDTPAPTQKVSSSGLKKRKARVSVSNGSVKKQGRVSNKVSTATVSTPTPTQKPSFKIGEMIQRVASQLTGPSPGPKVDHGQQVDQTLNTPENSQVEASVSDMLSQLLLTAQDPMKEYGFFQTIILFFYERRAAVYSKSLKKPPTVEKPDSDETLKPPNEHDPEEFDFDFDFDDVNDSYWTDRIIQNHSEDQPMQDNQDNQNWGVEEYPVVVHEPEKPAKQRRRSSKKEKRAVDNNHKSEPEPEPEEESEVDRKRRENLATEIILKFEEGINFRSEVQLNKMFKRFGPLIESETEVDRAGGRARVVFKKCFDAEVAHNSAGRFNIFGSVNVSYELNYSPLVSYKPLPLLLPVLQEDPLPALQEDPLPALQEDPLPVLQEDPLPALQEDPLPVLQEDPLPALQEDPLLVLQEDPQTVLQDPLPVLQEEPLPVLQDDPLQVQEDLQPVLQEEALLVLQEEEPLPILEKEPLPKLQDDPMDVC